MFTHFVYNLHKYACCVLLFTKQICMSGYTCSRVRLVQRVVIAYASVYMCACSVQLQHVCVVQRLCLSCFRSSTETARRACLCVGARFSKASAKIFRHALLSLLLVQLSIISPFVLIFFCCHLCLCKATFTCMYIACCPLKLSSFCLMNCDFASKPCWRVKLTPLQQALQTCVKVYKLCKLLLGLKKLLCLFQM